MDQEARTRLSQPDDDSSSDEESPSSDEESPSSDSLPSPPSLLTEPMPGDLPNGDDDTGAKDTKARRSIRRLSSPRE